MTREEKNQAIDELSAILEANKVLYLTDTSGMTVEHTSQLRRACFEKNIQLKVVKNTLLKKAMEKSTADYSPLFETLHGTTAIMTSDVGNAPAKLVKDFLRKHDKPAIKGAYVESDCYTGDNLLDTLVAIKSREELIGDIIGLLQSPIKNVVSGLQNSGGQKIAGLLKTLEEKKS